MNTPELEYEAACVAGNLAAHVEDLAASELRELHYYAVAKLNHNGCKGGIPAIVKWACVLEAAKRFLK